MARPKPVLSQTLRGNRVAPDPVAHYAECLICNKHCTNLPLVHDLESTMIRSASTLVLIFACSLACGIDAVRAAETPLPNGLVIDLLPGYTQQKLQGIDSIVGKFVKKDGPEISYEIGGYIPPGQPRFGGSYTDYAQQMPADSRLWLKELAIGGRKISVAYSKDQRIVVSTHFEKVGINFSATAKTPEEIAEVLLMAMTIAEPPKK